MAPVKASVGGYEKMKWLGRLWRAFLLRIGDFANEYDDAIPAASQYTVRSHVVSALVSEATFAKNSSSVADAV